MEILNTFSFKDFPPKVSLGYAHITEGISLDHLSEAEHKEWKSFSNQKRKNEFLTGRNLFKFMLQNLGDTDLNYKLKKDSLGKPFAEDGSKKLFVSFSHSSDLVFCAISNTTDIGLDTEVLNRQIDEGIVKRILGEYEWEVFANEDPILLWTIKEAAVKCLGTGLRTNLKDLEIQKRESAKYFVRINDEKTFQICSFQELNHQISIAY